MLLPIPLLGLVVSFLLPAAVRGSALTTAISANERLCFYADADKAGEKIGVSRHLNVVHDSLLTSYLYLSVLHHLAILD